MHWFEESANKVQFLEVLQNIEMEDCTYESVVVAYWTATYDGSKPALKGEVEITPKCPFTGISVGNVLVSEQVPDSEFTVFAVNPLKIYCHVNLPIPHIPLGAVLCLKTSC